MTVQPTSPFTPITRTRRVNTPKAKKPSARRAQKATRRLQAAPGGGHTAVSPPPPPSRSKTPRANKPEPVEDSPCSEPVALPLASCAEDSAVIILDWDDTLLSSTHLASMGYRLELEQQFSPELRAQLDELQSQVVHLLERLIEAVGADNLVIITNAERGWVELSAKKFVPEVLPTLEKCHVVSARSTFEISGSGPFEWKLLAFYHKIQQSFGFRIPPPLAAMHPHSPYVRFLQRLYESNGPQELLPVPEPPCQLDRHSEHNICYTNLPDLDGLESGDTTDSEEEAAKKNQDPEGPRVSAGGGLLGALPSDDKENVERNSTSTVRAPRSMILDEQNAYHDEDENESREVGEAFEDELADDLISPYHLYDSGLNFVLSPDHEELEQAHKYVFSFGDSLAEKHAAYNVVQNMTNTTLKTIKFLERPTITQVCKQLTLLEQHLDYILECRRPLDIVLNPNPE